MKPKLTVREQKIAAGLGARHSGVRVYTRKDGAIMLSREAMYSPGLRERFYIRWPRAIPRPRRTL